MLKTLIGLSGMVAIISTGSWLSKWFNSDKPEEPAPAADEEPELTHIRHDTPMMMDQTLPEQTLHEQGLKMADSGIYARLQILRGYDDLRSAEMNKTVWNLGRETAAGAHQAFVKQNISGLHCTISYDRTTNQFLLVDHDSANGTFLDGIKLIPHKPYPITGEAEIRLAQKDPIIMRFVPALKMEETLIDTAPPPKPQDAWASSQVADVHETWNVNKDLRDSSVSANAKIPMPQSHPEIVAGLIRNNDQRRITYADGIPQTGDEEDTQKFRALSEDE